MPTPFLRSLLALSLLAGLLVPTGATAQAVETFDTPPRVFVGGDFLIASPTGQFAENVSTGFGIEGFARFAVDEAGILSFRLNLGVMNYGSQTINICITFPCFVTGEITTSNNIVLGGFGPEIGIGTGPVRLFGLATAGFAYFVTTSSVEGENNDGDPFASSNNQSDGTFAWTAGGGGQFRVSSGRNPVWISLGARYHGNGEAEYLRRGDIQAQPDGSVVIDPQRSDTNLWTFQIGASVGVRPDEN